MESGISIKEVRNDNELIATIDENNNLIFNPNSTYQALYSIMDNYLELGDLQKENQKELMAINKIEKIENLDEKEIDNLIHNGDEHTDDDKEKKEEKVSRDLNDEITNIKEIQDEEFYEKIPGMRKNGKNAQVGFSKQKNEFVVFSKNSEGKYEYIPQCSQSNNIKKEVLILKEDGKTLQKVRVNAIINTNKKDEFIAIDFGQYGYTDEYMLSRDDDSHIVGRQMDVRGEKHLQQQVKEEIDEKDEVHYVGEAGDNLENNEQKIIHNEQIQDEVIYLNDGREITINEIARKLGKSPEETKRLYNESPGNEPEIKLNNMIKNINRNNSEKEKEDDEENQRTPWGDAERRQRK